MYSHRGSSNTTANRFITTTASDSFGNVGGPTPTTPTLTPTTLKNIEESFMEMSGIPPAPLEHQHQAGFVPPLVNISFSFASQTANTNNIHNNNNKSGGEQSDYATDEIDTDDSSSQSNGWMDYASRSSNEFDMNGNKPKNGRRSTHTGGRRPKNEKLSPEEEKKRLQRRERNKQAAARCRKRRLDHTNSLLRETDGLEEKKHALHQEIEQLKMQKEELEFILQTHKANCKWTAKAEHNIDIKPKVCSGNIFTPTSISTSKCRPNSLPLACVYGSNHQDNYKMNNMSEAGISIQTPSNGLFLDSMLEGGTGLTPILNSISSALTPSTLVLTPSTTTCGSQQRNSTTPSREISSPDSVKLIVPL